MPNVIHMRKMIVLVAEAIMVSFFQFQLFLGKTSMLLWNDHANRKRLIVTTVKQISFRM